MIFNTLDKDADMERVMIDATIIRAHQHSFGAKGGKESGIRAFLQQLFNKNLCSLAMHTAIRYDSFLDGQDLGLSLRAGAN
jgi:hypothetical protein